MEELINDWAKQKTYYQLIIAIMAVMMVVGFMSKHFKSIIEAIPSIRKSLACVQKKWFSTSIFRADMLRFMDSNQLHNNLMKEEMKAIRMEILNVKNEVTYNGGKITTVQAIKNLEMGVAHLKWLRDISEKFAPEMSFRYHPQKGVTFISESFLKGFGCRESNVKHFAFSDLVHPEDRHEMSDKWKVAVETKTPFAHHQRIKTGTGDYQLCDVKAEPIIINDELFEFKGIIEIIYH